MQETERHGDRQDCVGLRHGRTGAWAIRPWASRGRLYPEANSPTRSEFQRDRGPHRPHDGLRRLKHKTQVFIGYDGDHYRTRLTHTIEVAQIARAWPAPSGWTRN